MRVCVLKFTVKGVVVSSHNVHGKANTTASVPPSSGPVRRQKAEKKAKDKQEQPNIFSELGLEPEDLTEMAQGWQGICASMSEVSPGMGEFLKLRLKAIMSTSIKRDI